MPVIGECRLCGKQGPLGYEVIQFNTKSKITMMMDLPSHIELCIDCFEAMSKGDVEVKKEGDNNAEES